MMHMTMAVMLLHSVTSLILHHIWVKQRVSFHKDKRVVDNNSFRFLFLSSVLYVIMQIKESFSSDSE